jgi:Xaa-Pro aminopeptidase
MNLPFSTDEYEARRTAVRAVLADRDISLLLVTQPANLNYLTGYEACWYPSRLPVGALIDRESTDVVVFDWDRHAGYVTTSVLASDVVLFRYGEAAATMAQYFSKRGLGGRSLAVEWSAPTPTAPVMTELAGQLMRTGISVVSGDWIVDNVRLYKSAAETACMRHAARMADNAMRRLWVELQPGITELEVSARLMQLLALEGSEIPATPVLVNSGPTAWRDVHAFPSTRRLEPGDLVTVDCCGVSRRYHANLGRSFVLGERETCAREIIAAGAGSLEVLCRQARLDEDPAPAMRAAEQHVRDRVPQQNIWWIGGYNLGISFPPSWVGHTYLANDGLQKCRLAEGAAFNFENVYSDPEEGFEGGCIDTVIMTRQGLEPLSGLPRQLLDVPA